MSTSDKDVDDEGAKGTESEDEPNVEARDQEELVERISKGSWMGVLDEAIKTRFVDDERHHQTISAEEEGYGFTMTVFPNYGASHYGLTPSQASGVAVALPDGGHIVKARGLTPDSVIYEHWDPSGPKRRPAWSTSSLADVAKKFRLPLESIEAESSN